MRRIKYVLLFIFVLLISGSVSNKKFITDVDIDRNVMEGNDITNISGACIQYQETLMSIHVSTNNISLVAGESETISAYALVKRVCIEGDGTSSTSQRPVSISNSAPVSIEGIGSYEYRITGESTGSGAINFTYNGSSQSVYVTVVPALYGFNYSISESHIVEGSSFNINIIPDGGAIAHVSASSSNNSVVSISSFSNSQIKLNALKPGTATITMDVTGGHGEYYTKSVHINVDTSFYSFNASVSNVNLVEGNNSSISFTHNAISGLSSITAKSYDSSIVSVSMNNSNLTANIVAKKKGSTDIEFEATDKNGTKRSTTVHVDVSTSFTSLNVSPSNIILSEGESKDVSFTHNAYTGLAQITAISYDSNKVDVIINNNNNNFTVKIRGRRAGDTVVYFEVTDMAGTKRMISVSVNVKTSFTYLSVSPENVVLNVNNGTNISISHNSYLGIKKTTWRSDNESIAHVSGDLLSGTIIGVAEGSTTIRVEVTDYGDTTLTKTINVTVNPLEIQMLHFENSNYSVKVGKDLQLRLLYSPQEANLGSVTFTSTNPSVATVSNTGLVSGLAVGTTTVKASKSTRNGIVEAYTTINVSSNSDIKLDLVTNIKLLKVNEEKDLHFSISGLGSLTFNPSWSSSDSSVVSIDNHGHIKALKAGVATITVKDANIGVSTGTTIEVIVPITKVRPTNAKPKYSLGESSKLEYSLEPATATPRLLNWSSSNPGVVDVLQDGTITVISPGEATISVVTQDGDVFDVTTISVGAAQNNAVDPTEEPGNGEPTNNNNNNLVDNPNTGLTISVMCVIILIVGFGLFKFISKYFNNIRKI